ncbi:glucuronyl esterase domain-containing protein [Hyphococcus luteus]|uniref:Alpha/beta hydrolase n=1 Tax=Hyphococcus luteus TaxID=2058213 RepID=A0A2S7K794_9PROT|nr:alpha/beta hydrolase [Marinicaulis flavus]PQA88390.1 alpha/beta hydrolase [Marinicaulis flavus]
MFKPFPRLLLAAAFFLALPACARLTLAWTNLKPEGEPARPQALGAFDGAPPVKTIGEWRTSRAPVFREALQREVYGFLPDASQTRVLSHEVINPSAFGGRAVLEEYRLAVAATFNGVSVETTGADEETSFVMDVALPVNAKRPAPVILMETFCQRWNTLPDPAVAGAPEQIERGGGIMTYVFGRYICTPPVDAILDAGYAVATIYPGEIVPDKREEGLKQLRRLSAGYEDDETRWGAVAAWGWAFSRMVDVLADDPRIDQDAVIAWGHSRYAKAALVAAAFDARIDGVIAHQSGTGGASLNREKKGESVKAITDTYPHWFSRAYAGFAGREDEIVIDQHALLALIAPRPVLLGNARRDVWSDPNGAFRAAMGADAVYEMLGSDGLEQGRLDIWKPGADLAFWIRPGTHGVVEEDWPAFLEFLDAHFKADAPSLAAD